MSDESKRAENSPAESAPSSARLLANCSSLLRSLQNADGGWAFHAGEQSRVEPTCWALRALSNSDLAAGHQTFRKTIDFLHASQLADGSWPAAAQVNAGSWVTSLACSALSINRQSAKNVQAGLKWICEDFPRDSSPFRRFVQRLRPKSETVSQNDSYRGWGWTPRTASWVEPTAFALMALQAADPELLPKNAAQRRKLAIALLYDRMCPGGGWNCGNPRVYGVDGDPLVLPTCWALLALHGHEAQGDEGHGDDAQNDVPVKPGRALSLAWLQKEFAKIQSPGSLAAARMTLENYGVLPHEVPYEAHDEVHAASATRRLHDWTAHEFAEQGTHVLAWASMALNPSRRWPAISAPATTITSTASAAESRQGALP
jgi:hypothetical protein